MNGNFYQNPTFPSSNFGTPPGNVSVSEVNNSNLPDEQSYIENILRLNKGRKIKAYVSYPDSSAWQNKVYEGIIEEAGRDHLIIRDNTNNLWYLIRIIYLNYVEFMEPIIYSHSFSEPISFNFIQLLYYLIIIFKIILFSSQCTFRSMTRINNYIIGIFTNFF